MVTSLVCSNKQKNPIFCNWVDNKTSNDFIAINSDQLGSGNRKRTSRLCSNTTPPQHITRDAQISSWQGKASREAIQSTQTKLTSRALTF